MEEVASIKSNVPVLVLVLVLVLVQFSVAAVVSVEIGSADKDSVVHGVEVTVMLGGLTNGGPSIATVRIGTEGVS
jgi:hypothetical protein